MKTIGFHIKKEKTFKKSVEWYNNIPCQLFTGSNRSWKKVKPSKEDIEDTKKIIKSNKISLFIHSIYLINLARYDLKSYNRLKYDVVLGHELGSEGVIVHCGKHLKMSKTDAIDNMYNNILNLLGDIKKSCPLLLETSSGAGTELLEDFQDFSMFYDRFTELEKIKIKICIDTCHVFAAGHDPYLYITKWNRKHPNSIKLIHYNDSKYKKGCRKDRHALPGKGFIGDEKMNQIKKYCEKNKICMVIE